MSKKRKFIALDPVVKEKFEELKKSDIKFALLKKDSDVFDYLIDYYLRSKSEHPHPDPLSSAILVTRFLDVVASDDVQELIQKKLLS